jgi:hypothetical protein
MHEYQNKRDRKWAICKYMKIKDDTGLGVQREMSSKTERNFELFFKKSGQEDPCHPAIFRKSVHRSDCRGGCQTLFAKRVQREKKMRVTPGSLGKSGF